MEYFGWRKLEFHGVGAAQSPAARVWWLALFNGSNPTTASAVPLDAPITLNVLVLANSKSNLDRSRQWRCPHAHQQQISIVPVTSGSHIISAPVSMNTTTISA